MELHGAIKNSVGIFTYFMQKVRTFSKNHLQLEFLNSLLVLPDKNDLHPILYV